MSRQTLFNLITTVIVIMSGVLYAASHRDIVKSCVVVREGKSHFGSGAVVGRHEVLTAGHVTDDPNLSVIVNGTTKRLPVVYVMQESADKAILFVDEDLPQPIPIAVDPAQEGDEVYSIGAPAHWKLAGSYLYGHVVKTDVNDMSYGGFGPFDHMVLTDFHIYGGISGAPVIKDGEVVGVVVGLYCDYCIVSPVTGLEWLRR